MQRNISEWNSRVDRIIQLCKSKYNEQQFDHCAAVGDYVFESFLLNGCSADEKANVYIIAMCHDLIEDTDCIYDEIENLLSQDDECEHLNEIDEIIDAIRTLTKPKGFTYIDYITSIKKSEDVFAYAVKLADMKDHLSRKETLTDKLKDKYLNALHYLL